MQTLKKIVPTTKMVRLVRIFHFSLAFFLLLGTLLLNGCTDNSVAAVPLQWKQADSIPPTLSQLAVNENTSATPNSLNDVLVASIPTKDKKQLYIFNYNSPDTCGKLGCLYVGYLDKGESSYQRVLNLYLQPNLPPKHSLINVNSDGSSSSLSCLDIKQVDKSHLQIVTYCFNGSFYQPTKSIQMVLK